MSEWTKGEWVSAPSVLYPGQFEISSIASDRWIARVQQEEDAGRLVTCVNGFDALVEALTEACDLLRENKQGNPARSAAHNARLVIEAALANASPKKTVGNLLPPSTSNPEGK